MPQILFVLNMVWYVFIIHDLSFIFFIWWYCLFIFWQYIWAELSGFVIMFLKTLYIYTVVEIFTCNSFVNINFSILAIYVYYSNEFATSLKNSWLQHIAILFQCCHWEKCIFAVQLRFSLWAQTLPELQITSTSLSGQKRDLNTWALFPLRWRIMAAKERQWRN